MNAIMILLAFWMVSFGDRLAPLEDPKLFNGTGTNQLSSLFREMPKVQVTSLSKCTEKGCKYILT